jgi:aryl-alcohol dehydrogenase-like predicted oxidoreductase
VQNVDEHRGSKVSLTISLFSFYPPPEVNENIERSLRGTSVISLDLLQFHWWDYNNPYYVDALKYLSDLRDKGIIKHIGLKF